LFAFAMLDICPFTVSRHIFALVIIFSLIEEDEANSITFYVKYTSNKKFRRHGKRKFISGSRRL
jgi:hypothetical protein